MTRFTRQQTFVLIGLILAYMAAYFCRLNLAPALPGIMKALTIDEGRAGTLQTCFAVVYAAGQFVNGAVVDRVDPVKYMFFGLAGSIACNVLMGLCSVYGLFIVLCLLNGAFQSMLWTPVVRIMAIYFTDKPRRDKANILVNISLIGGHLGALAIVGYFSDLLGWHYSFRLPAYVTLLVGLIAFLFIRAGGALNVRELILEKRKETLSGPNASQKGGGAFRVFAATGFITFLVCCLCYGFVRDSVNTWTPTILKNLSGGDSALATSCNLIIPLVNFVGTLVGYYIRKKDGINARRFTSSALLLVTLSAACLILTVNSLYLTAAMLALSCAFMYSVYPIVTATIPLEYDRLGCVGMATGMIDSVIYVGSALSGFLGGILYQYNPAVLFAALSVTALIGGVFCRISSYNKAYLEKMQN